MSIANVIVAVVNRCSKGNLIVHLDTTNVNYGKKKEVNTINKTWTSAVRTALYLRGKTQKDMAKDLGVSYQYIRGVMCGINNAPSIIAKIEAYCGMSTEQ